MKRYIRRLVWRDNDVLINPLSHIFFLITLVMGLAFGAFPDFFHVETTVLFVQTLVSFPDLIANIWGWAMLAVSIANVILLMTRWRFGQCVAMAGFMGWLYAALVYILAGYWFGLLAVAIPNLLFWVYYFMSISEYHNQPPIDF